MSTNPVHPIDEVLHAPRLAALGLVCCGLVTLIQALGATQGFGIKLPVMRGVTFAPVAPMVAMAGSATDGNGAGRDASQAIAAAKHADAH